MQLTVTITVAGQFVLSRRGHTSDVHILDVEPNSEAYWEGLRSGDRILTVNGTTIEARDLYQVRQMIQRVPFTISVEVSVIAWNL
jgi:predicted metalloprotease with PDZ domain